MNQCTKGSKKIKQLQQIRKEMDYDSGFLDEGVLQQKIESYTLRVKLAEAINHNKSTAMENLQMRDELGDLM